MARSDFAAGLTAILGGGACYWLAIIRPNTTDTWDSPTPKPKAFGTLKTYSLTGYTVMENRLVSVGDIDNKADPYKSPLSFIPDVEIEIQNVAADMECSGFQGRVFEIRFGYGSTMSEATSSIIFTGKIIEVKVSISMIAITARGKSQLSDKPAGTPVPDDVDDKYKGKNYPMTWGDWTDGDAYAPVVLNRRIDKYPDVVFDTKPWKSFKDLKVYDSESKIGYRAKTENGIVISANTNIASLVTATGDVLDAYITDAETMFKSSDVNIFALFSTAYDAKPLVLKIDDELIFVYKAIVDAGKTKIYAERGFFGSAPAGHEAASAIYSVNDDLARFSILCSHIFFINGVSGPQQVITPTGTGASMTLKPMFEIPDNGRYDDSVDTDVLSGGRFKGTIIGMNTNTIYPNTFYFYNLNKLNIVFSKIGIEGAVQAQYIILKILMRLKYNGNSGYGALTDMFWFVVSDSTWFVAEMYFTNNGSTFRIVWYETAVGRGSAPPGGGAGWVVALRTAGANDPTASGLLLSYPWWITYSSWTKLSALFGLYLGKGDTNTYQLIEQILLTPATATDSSLDIDNITDAGDETEKDYEITSGSGLPVGALLLNDVSDLSDAQYALRCNLKTTCWNNLEAWFTLFKIGMRLDFYVSPIKFDFYARGEARKNPGGYYNGDAGDLMENPSSVIEDFLRTADDGSAIMSMAGAYFVAAYTSRAAWKLAHSVYSKDKDRPKFRDALEEILSCSGVCCFERYDGSLGIVDLDDPGSVTRTIEDSEVKVDSNKNAEVDYSYLPADLMITSIEIKYKPILPEDGKYAAVYKLQRNGSGPTEYLGYLQEAYETLGEDRPLVVEAPAIRDADTAEALAFLIIKLRYKPLVQIELRGTYSLMDIELLDKVGVNLTALPAAINAKTFMVTGVRVKPHTNGDKPDVKITLTELGTATITEATIWQDSASAPTNVKTEVASGGRVIMEV